MTDSVAVNNADLNKSVRMNLPVYVYLGSLTAQERIVPRGTQHWLPDVAKGGGLQHPGLLLIHKKHSMPRFVKF